MWAKHKKQTGFTIVELLIVIVIIGILAAITIVAFNGVQNRARSSAAQSLLSQASKKVMAYQATEGSYPSDLTTAGMTSTTDLQYSATATTYCLTASNGDVSYFLSNSQSSPQSGGCAGHGQGGASAITNLATNPSFESTLSVNSYNATNLWGSGGGASGARFLRSTRTNTTGPSGPWWDGAVVTPGLTYHVRLSVRSNAATARYIRIEWINPAGTSQVSSQLIATVSPSGSWTSITGSGTAPTGAGRLRITAYTDVSSTGVTTDYVDIDSVIITEGTAAASFADGNTQNWIWNGGINSSTSTGPAP